TGFRRATGAPSAAAALGWGWASSRRQRTQVSRLFVAGRRFRCRRERLTQNRGGDTLRHGPGSRRRQVKGVVIGDEAPLERGHEIEVLDAERVRDGGGLGVEQREKLGKDVEGIVSRDFFPPDLS